MQVVPNHICNTYYVHFNTISLAFKTPLEIVKMKLQHVWNVVVKIINCNYSSKLWLE